MAKKYELQKGTHIGGLFQENYTDRKKQKRVKLRGYILLGIFSGACLGLEIFLQEISKEKSSIQKSMFVIKSGKKHVGFFIKEEGVSSNGNKYHYLNGKLNIGGISIRICAYPNRQYFNAKEKEKKDNSSIPDYNIELAQSLEFGVVKLC